MGPFTGLLISRCCPVAHARVDPTANAAAAVVRNWCELESKNFRLKKLLANRLIGIDAKQKFLAKSDDGSSKLIHFCL
jgi:hypothetical protein